MWPTENPWPLVFLFVIAAVIGGILWKQQGRGVYLAGSVLCLGLAVGSWVIERWILTERERIEAAILGLTGAFQRRDLDGAVFYVSRQSPELRLMIGTAYNMSEVDDDMRVSDIQVELTNQQTRAITRFRVNATVTLKPPLAENFRRWEPSRWEAKWQLEGADWKLLDIVDLDPVTGRNLGRIEMLREIVKRAYPSSP